MMKTEVVTSMDNQSVIHAISQDPKLLDSIISLETIWFPEWKRFSIVKANHVHLPFEYEDMEFHNTCYQVMLNSFIERMHFHELEER